MTIFISLLALFSVRVSAFKSTEQRLEGIREREGRERGERERGRESSFNKRRTVCVSEREREKRECKKVITVKKKMRERERE